MTRSIRLFVPPLLLILLSLPGWADYEIYRTDGFEKVYEVLERKEQSDGTFMVKVRRTKQSEEIVEIYKVVEVKKVEPKSGPQYMERKPIEKPPPPSIVEAPPPSRSGGEDVPWVRQLSRTVVLGVMGVLGSFLLLFIWVKSSN